MNDETHTIQAGQLLCFSTGEYSDFGYCGHFVALETITPEKMKEAALRAKTRQAENETEREAWSQSGGTPFPRWLDIHNAFIDEMIRAGLLLVVTVNEVHIGSYSEIEISGVDLSETANV